MKQKMEKEQYRVAKVHLVAGMQEGQSWQRAAASAGLQISQSNAYQLWKAFRQKGELALRDGRHGHPSKLRGEARTFLETTCREAPQTPSSAIQAALQNRFGLSVSVSQINRVRAALGVSNHATEQEKKQVNRKCCSLIRRGRTGLAVFCYLLLRSLQACSPSFKQPSHQATSPLIHHCVSPTINQQHCTVSC